MGDGHDVREKILISKEMNDNGFENVEAFFSQEEHAELEAITQDLEAQEDLICVLDGLMARALSGELKGIAYVTVSDIDAVGSGWTGTDCRATLGHGISLLGLRYNTACLENMETIED